MSEIDKKIINNIRGLSIDMINKANSGHPGIALGAAPILYTLFAKVLKISRENPRWISRDRFILSAGHGSSLLYSLLFYLDYLKLEDLKKFRSLNSKTPGHPEIETLGVEMSTGPLGQGIASSVGFAIAEKYLSNYFNDDVINYKTYCLVGDGDLEEGVALEAMSIAGNLSLNNLIVLYDSNEVTLDGSLYNSSIDNIELKVKSMNWNYIFVKDGENIVDIENAIKEAKRSDKPVLIEIRTVIGRYSLLQGTHKVHGAPLIKEDIEQLKEKLDLRNQEFSVSQETIDEFQKMVDGRNQYVYENWLKKKDILDDKLKIELDNFINKKYELVFEGLKGEDEAVRVSNSKVLNLIAKENPFMIGGSADLRESTKANIIDSGYFNKDNYKNRNIPYGIREHAMGAISNGLALSNLVPFASTFLSFSDYLKPSIRLSALMNLFVIYIFTHDSITVGEDGPTHQPIEQLVGLRSIPNLDVYRPNDLNEVIGCYKTMFKRRKASCLIASRNKTKLKNETQIKLVEKGGYILKETKEVDFVIISCGEELDLAVDIFDDLSSKGYNLRLISMPSLNIFKEQSEEYQKEVLTDKKKFVIEFSSSMSWTSITDEKRIFSVNSFGKSGKVTDILEYFNLTHDTIEKEILKMINER
jgi:transketolase